MTLTSLLVENFVSSISSNDINNKMIGGASMMKNAPKSSNFLTLLLIVLIILLIKALIVYIGYNFIVPRIIYSMSQEPNKTLEKVEANFRKITYLEALILSIFVSTLFSS